MMLIDAEQGSSSFLLASLLLPPKERHPIHGSIVVCCCTGRVHLIKVQLPAAYPEAAPLVTAQLPKQVKLPAWQPGASSLQNLIKNHEDAIASLQDLWACLEDLDRYAGSPAVFFALSDRYCATHWVQVLNPKASMTDLVRLQRPNSVEWAPCKARCTSLCSLLIATHAMIA